MMLRAMTRRSAISNLLTLAALGSLCAVASAGGIEEQLNRKGQLVGGVGYVVPTYQAGAKFRTPESMESALLEEVARSRKAVPVMRKATAATRAQMLVSGEADLILAVIPEGDPLARKPGVIFTGYSASPMAIMRTDTTIKTWEQLKGRTVCVSEGSPFKGTIGARYGAIEKHFPAPADSLLALRVGGCDAAVHDSTMLEELLLLPEWKKFSARLTSREKFNLAFMVAPADGKSAKLLTGLTNRWKADRTLSALNEKRVKHIAFEVYLDQNVPDCH